MEAILTVELFFYWFAINGSATSHKDLKSIVLSCDLVYTLKSECKTFLFYKNNKMYRKI